MCGRYIIDSDAEYEEIIKTVGAAEDMRKFKTGEIFPTDTAPIVAGQDRTKKLQWARWGFQSFDKKPIINARCETVQSKPLFKNSLINRRCLVPASAYFEWHLENSRKVKYRISLKNYRLFYMAGLYNTFAGKDNIPFTGFVIITTSASNAVRGIHDRMPVILEPGNEDLWLNGDTQNCGSILNMLGPYKNEDLYLQSVM